MPEPIPSTPARFLGAIFGIVFAGIGLTVIFFLWTANGFGEPPLFFRIFGSFIALAFVGFGGTLLVSVLKGQSAEAPAPATTTSPPSIPSASPGTAPAASYTCPACGARLGENADVSPKGDVKCGYCRKWFNIHG